MKLLVLHDGFKGFKNKGINSLGFRKHIKHKMDSKGLLFFPILTSKYLYPPIDYCTLVRNSMKFPLRVIILHFQYRLVLLLIFLKY